VPTLRREREGDLMPDAQGVRMIGSQDPQPAVKDLPGVGVVRSKNLKAGVEDLPELGLSLRSSALGREGDGDLVSHE
jgi:hypothetical protein